MSRRAAILLIAGGAGAAGLHTTGAFDIAEVPRQADVGIADDDRALLGIDPGTPRGPGEPETLVTLQNNASSSFTDVSVDVGDSDQINVNIADVPDRIPAGGSSDVTATITCSGVESQGDVIEENVDLDVSVSGSGVSVAAQQRTVSVECEVPPEDPPEIFTVDLLAGQFCHAGDISVENDDRELTVTYDTGETEWSLTETHLAASADEPEEGGSDGGPGGGPGGGAPDDGEDNEWLDEGWQNPAGNPAPGRFPESGDHVPPEDEVTYTIPLEDVTGGVSSGDTVYVAAHASVERDQNDPGDDCGVEEGAWADGEEFDPDAGWATYFEYEIE